jgi:DNA-binding NarL/FixJ family response regulator
LPSRPAAETIGGGLEPTRVLVIDMPAILHDIVTDALSRTQELVVVGDVSDETLPLAPEVERTNPSVVLLGSDHPELAGGRVPVFTGRADLKLLALTADGTEATLYELRPHTTTLGELSPGTLAQALRSAGLPGEDDRNDVT